MFHCKRLRQDADLSHLCTRHSGSCCEQTGGEFTLRHPMCVSWLFVEVCVEIFGNFVLCIGNFGVFFF